MMATEIDLEFDVVVAGAGMIGCICAAAIAQSGIRVALIDPHLGNTTNSASNSARVSTINLASENILRALNVWQRIDTAHLSPFRQLEIWDANSVGKVSFCASDMGITHFGHILQNEDLLSALTHHLTKITSVVFFSGEMVETIDINDSAVQLTLTNKLEISGKLLIAADGITSRTRSLVKIPTAQTPYAHRAIVTTVITETSHKQTAYQQFLSTGPLAFLPLHDGRSSVVWSCTTKYFTYLESLENNDFENAISEATDNRFGRIKMLTRRRSFPLFRLRAHNYIASRVALVGDAVHTVHPLAGLGANIGFSDAASLAEVVVDAYKKRRDIGSYNVLRRYERWRRSENHLLLNGIDILYSMFNNNDPINLAMRGIGMNIVDRTSQLKQLFIQRAVGLSVDAPRIAQPTMSSLVQPKLEL